jgi:type I restriction enzyme S subunit
MVTKQSLLGPIPIDWFEGKFEDVFTGFSSGMTPYRGTPEYYKGNTPWITSGELNYNIINDTIEKITYEAVTKTNLKLLPKGTFLMAITGLEAAGTRGSCAITGIEATTNQSCMALYPITGKSLTEYLYHFYVKYGNKFAFEFCQGTKQQSYTGRIVRILPIVLPPTLNEQKAIASALSDVDELIAKLEKLIEKKKAIKQGAMQALLTPPHKGGKRLEGFSGDWVEKTVGEFGEVITGGTPSTEVESYWNGDFTWVTPTDIGIEREISTSERMLSESGINQIRKLPPNSLLVTCIASIGKNVILKTEGACNQQINAIVPNQEHDSGFLYFLIELNKNLLISNAGVTATMMLSKKEFSKLNFWVPRIEEQTSIAKILTAIDIEISGLRSRKIKLLYIKQGMMQELLTGRTRLV